MKVAGCSFDVSWPGQAEGATAEFQDQIVTVGEVGQFPKWNWFTDAHAEICADAPCGFTEDEGEAQGQADVAGDLEQSGILPREEHGNDGGFRHAYEFCREGSPGQIHGLGMQGPFGGGNAACRKYSNRTALFQPVLGCHARPHIGFAGFSCWRKGDGQQMCCCFGGLAEHVIGQNLCVGPGLQGKPCEGNAIQHTIGMVGNENDGAGLGHLRQRIGIIGDVDAQQPHGAVKKTFAFRKVLLMAQIKLLEFALTANFFNGLDNGALQPGLIGCGIGKAQVRCDGSRF